MDESCDGIFNATISLNAKRQLAGNIFSMGLASTTKPTRGAGRSINSNRINQLIILPLGLCAPDRDFCQSVTKTGHLSHLMRTQKLKSRSDIRSVTVATESPLRYILHWTFRASLEL
jgi:hypothetical protein